ncbi:tRNA lysidine(34) synthetase TilS [Luteibacter aegosomatissinici]|uniref:tRNA lysidine(34) synthetase TilS n=1 Tax=Luteibacter aegosomatissinici TaxID=2911539 RepID=UPI001FFA20CA|nr:tRNA lysidine(34) synthetase TilS [Luteibacter aegosomatissinici]UPG95616.1 tRNA lysidine(34) synthetase TilS [Luteibacter aegosomatissinici]
MSIALSDHLSAALADLDDTPLVVAYSGGPDSTALLHALAMHAPRPVMRALHIDHGLHAESGAWAVHCRRFCESLDVPFESVRVSVDLSRGEGVEGAARRARRAAFAASLRPGERMVLAHHHDDQVETVLLKLMRGAGPEGLAGMRERRAMGAGEQWRPLLGLPRDALLDHIALHALHTIHDPSNDDPRVARAWLRSTVLPALREHWPHAGQSIVHSARLCGEAAACLRDGWMEAYGRLRGPDGSLDAPGWLALPDAWRGPLLDQWLHAAGLSAPTTAQRDTLERQAREAAAERLPLVGWLDTEVRVWRGKLWAMPRQKPFDTAWSSPWRGEPLALPGGGSLTLGGRRLPAAVTVRYRQGGESLKPAGDRHTRELRDLLQRGGVPPWERPRMPLVVDGDTVLAVADRWLSEAGKPLFDAAGALPLWHRGD